MNLGAYIAYGFACKVPTGHGSWKSEDGLNVDGDLGYATQWPSLEIDIVCPVIALCLYRWSQSPLGMTSHLKGRARRDIYRPITAQSVKLYQLVTAPCPTLLSLLMWRREKKKEKRKKRTVLEPTRNCRATHMHIDTRTHRKSEGSRKTLTCPFPSKASMPELRL